MLRKRSNNKNVKQTTATTWQKSETDFPAIGMTLNTYKHDPLANLKGQSQINHLPKPSIWRRIINKFTLKRLVILFALIVVFAVGWLGWKFADNIHRLFGGSAFSIFTTSQLQGENVGRVNILLAGDSADDPGHQGADLTDSIMLLSIDTKNNQAFMLSVPRDLYVSIPGNGYAKINAANVIGNGENFKQSGLPYGGMGLLEKIIEQKLNININYYALINYNAFRQAVNSVGGIDVTINNPDGRLYDPNRDWVTKGPLVDLRNGRHHLNGEQALDLARARGDPSPYGYSIGFKQSDFERTANQRMMLLALKNKAVSAAVITNPIKLGQLFDAIGKNVKTDFSLSGIHRLYDLTKGINTNTIKSISLNNVNGDNLLQSYTASDGELALIPAAGLNNYSQIQAYMHRLTSNDPIIKEDASVVLLNATDSYGIAAKQQLLLKARNVNVAAVGDAQTTQSVTLIIDNSNGRKPATKQLLQKLYGTNQTTLNPYAAIYKADFIVILGADQVNSQ